MENKINFKSVKKSSYDGSKCPSHHIADEVGLWCFGGKTNIDLSLETQHREYDEEKNATHNID